VVHYFAIYHLYHQSTTKRTYRAKTKQAGVTVSKILACSNYDVIFENPQNYR
jgi:hypothetical protein